MNTMDVVLTIIRLLVGLLFFGHGARKLFGWFGGKGLTSTSERMSMLGFRPAKFWAFIAGLLEFAGGLSLVFGFLTPIGAAAIIGGRITSIIAAHAHEGLWSEHGGSEYPLVIIANALYFGLAGAGMFSLDSALKFSWDPAKLFVGSGIIFLIGLVIALLTTLRLSAQKHIHAS